MNLVLDDVKEITRGIYPSPLHPLEPPGIDGGKTDDEGNTSTRPLGLLVARGTLLVLISPLDGSEEIPNPFLQADEEDAAPAI